MVDFFEIGKSTNGTDYFIAGTVTAKNGTGSNTYSFTDTSGITDTTYYIDINILAAGIYLLSYVSINNKKSIKFIKN